MTETPASTQHQGMGPPAAFETAYKEHFPRVCHLVRRCGVADKDVLDAAHDVFVVACRRWSSLVPDAPVGPWLMGIAVRVAAARRRRAFVTQEVMGEIPESAQSPSNHGPEEVVRQGQARALVQRGLDALDDEKREVLVLHDLEGFSMPEIAAAGLVPINTLYSRLRVAREQFTAAVRRLQPQQDAP